MTPRPITIEQYEQFDGYPGLRDELVYGRIVMNPQPKPRHQQVRKNVEGWLDQACQGTDYLVNGDTNIKFPAFDSMPAPDVFVVAKRVWRQAIDSDDYLDTPPLLVVEVLSPSNRPQQVKQKVEIYLQSGVGAVWIVDLEEEEVALHMSSGHTTYKCGPYVTVPLPHPLRGKMLVTDVFVMPE